MAAAAVPPARWSGSDRGADLGALRLCEVVRGTSSCGGGRVSCCSSSIFLLMLLLGAALLRAFGVRDPGSTSLLGVGLLAVVGAAVPRRRAR